MVALKMSCNSQTPERDHHHIYGLWLLKELRPPILSVEFWLQIAKFQSYKHAKATVKKVLSPLICPAIVPSFKNVVAHTSRCKQGLISRAFRSDSGPGQLEPRSASLFAFWRSEKRLEECDYMILCAPTVKFFHPKTRSYFLFIFSTIADA
jgi:hypothetical protein